MTMPARGRVLVRPVETEETVPGGRILLTENARAKMAANQVQVVSIGLPDICDDEDCSRKHEIACEDETVPVRDYKLHAVHAIDERITEGAWCIIRPRSLFDAGHPTEKLYYVRQDDVLGVFRISEPSPTADPLPPSGLPTDAERADGES